MSLADGADLLLTLLIGEQPAANIAEHYDIPLATLHTYPMRPNGQAIPLVPAPLLRSGGDVRVAGLAGDEEARECAAS